MRITFQIYLFEAVCKPLSDRKVFWSHINDSWFLWDFLFSLTHHLFEWQFVSHTEWQVSHWPLRCLISITPPHTHTHRAFPVWRLGCCGFFFLVKYRFRVHWFPWNVINVYANWFDFTCGYMPHCYCICTGSFWKEIFLTYMLCFLHFLWALLSSFITIILTAASAKHSANQCVQ